MKKIFFYGDSNTWGFDPRDGSRYPADVRWTGLLSRALAEKCVIEPNGLNGRMVPEIHNPEVKNYVRKMLTDASPIDLFAVMLGTNDLWWPMHPDAADPARKMKEFLALVKEECNCRILLIAPPLIREDDGENSFPENERYIQSVRLTEEYRGIADEEGFFFADSGSWDISLCFDGVHFSEKGHRRFAEEMEKILKRILIMMRESAVLIPVVDSPEGPAFLMEVRSMNVMQPGEICFPGGGIDPGETPAQAAVREAGEELGILPEQIEILGELPEDTLHSRIVRGIPARIKNFKKEQLKLSEYEVAEVFTLPLSWLRANEPAVYDLKDPLSPEIPRKLMHYLKNYDLEGRGGSTYYWEYGQYGIWGLTARIIKKAVGYFDSF
ncbi:MAG: NUDIX domain-containing protein [Lachnospiraceae bacterium]|nr:NUDIX domain-containing protein [Lachnospiraceae bacterium]